MVFQARHVLDNVAAGLAGAGSAAAALLPMRVYVTDMRDGPPPRTPRAAWLPEVALHDGFKSEVAAVGLASSRQG